MTIDKHHLIPPFLSTCNFFRVGHGSFSVVVRHDIRYFVNLMQYCILHVPNICILSVQTSLSRILDFIEGDMICSTSHIFFNLSHSKKIGPPHLFYLVGVFPTLPHQTVSQLIVRDQHFFGKDLQLQRHQTLERRV